ncbi:MAG TPA: VOC family protein [Byssovorax sp.]|jgi:predicted enzyme related to lactoylglutathione lyase
MTRVTGIGGVFFKARDPKAIQAWYEKHLGVPTGPGGIVFTWGGDGSAPGQTIWAPFANDTKYFGPSAQSHMVNFRVADLDALLAELAKEGVEIIPERSDYDFGRFAWIVDCEGNRVELWEPKGE